MTTNQSTPRTRRFARMGTLMATGLVTVAVMAGPAPAASASPATPLRLTDPARPTAGDPNTSNPCNSLPEYCEPDAVDDFCKAQLKSTGFNSYGCLKSFPVSWV